MTCFPDASVVVTGSPSAGRPVKGVPVPLPWEMESVPFPPEALSVPPSDNGSTSVALVFSVGLGELGDNKERICFPRAETASGVILMAASELPRRRPRVRDRNMDMLATDFIRAAFFPGTFGGVLRDAVTALADVTSPSGRPGASLPETALPL